MARSVLASLAAGWVLSAVCSPVAAQPPLARVPLEGRVTDAATGAPIAGATVGITRANQQPVWQGQTDAEGRFLWPEGTEGKYEVLVRLEGYLEAERGAAIEGRAAVTLEIALAPQPVIHGRVLRPDGVTPLANTPILLAPIIQLDEHSQVCPTVTLVTSADGQFGLHAQYLGRWDVTAVAPGVGYATLPPFTLKPGEEPPELVLKLRPTSRITGKVVVKGTGEPVVGAEVRSPFAGRGLVPKTVTDAQGQFVLPDLMPAKHNLFVTAPGLLLASREVEVTGQGDVTGITLELERPKTVRGVVVGADGAPLARANVSGGGGGGVQTDAAGRFELPGLRAGDVQLTISAEGFAPVAHKVRVPETDDPPEQRIAVGVRGGTIAGTIVDGDTARPLAGVTVGAMADNDFHTWFEPFIDEWSLKDFGTFQWRGQKPALARADEQGRYGLSHLGPGPQTVFVLPEGMPNQWRAGIEVREGEATEGVDFEVALHVPGIVTGLFLDGDGQPMQNASAYATYQGDHWTASHPLGSSAEGRYFLRLPGEGAFALEVMMEGMAPVTKTVTLKAAEAPPDLDLTFVPEKPEDLGTVAGRVFRPDGTTPAVGVWVGLWRIGAPMAGAPRQWAGGGTQYSHDGGMTTRTAEDGMFKVEGVRPGRYAVSVSPVSLDGLPPAVAPPELATLAPAMTEPMEVKAGAAVEGIRVVLSEACAVSGQVTNEATGEPLRGTLMWTQPIAAAFIPVPVHEPLQTDAQGRYRIGGLPSGRYRVTAMRPGFAPKTVEVPLEPGDDLTLDIELTPQP
jgi:Carboxypeptidase regulatory-like domain